jgi:hypothetical protein
MGQSKVEGVRSYFAEKSIISWLYGGIVSIGCDGGIVSIGWVRTSWLGGIIHKVPSCKTVAL